VLVAQDFSPGIKTRHIDRGFTGFGKRKNVWQIPRKAYLRG
jgi:hypothetical protein